MSLIEQFIDLVLHLDRHLSDIIGRYGTWTYGILALILFCETGLVVTPLLPGDSLLFAAGTFAALGSLDPVLLNLLLFAAVLAGDNLNYWIGRFTGPRAFTDRGRFFRRDYLDRTHAFFQRHGGKTVVLARFIPIVRTFTPFVAGIGAMTYPRFLAYSIAGGALWVTMFVWSGYYFGNLPVVRNNFSLVILAIIVLSVVPLVASLVRERVARGS
ncbi:MAG TPA: DedA family protein [Gemmatimonadales bacterium]|jgi:membrane-associated protein|nr:DedA family protein [Gemmatimonadales bacterium]